MKINFENISLSENTGSAGSYGHGEILLIDNESDHNRSETLPMSFQWKFASKIQWPEPEDPYFQFLIEKQVKQGRKYGCQDKLMAYSLRNFLVAQREISEYYGSLCSEIDPTNLDELVSSLDGLNPSNKYKLPEERFQDLKPKESDNAITYMNRLRMLETQYFGNKATNLIKERRIQNQFLETFSMNGQYLSELERLILRQNPSLTLIAANASDILESKLSKFGLRQ